MFFQLGTLANFGLILFTLVSISILFPYDKGQRRSENPSTITSLSHQCVLLFDIWWFSIWLICWFLLSKILQNRLEFCANQKTRREIGNLDWIVSWRKSSLHSLPCNLLSDANLVVVFLGMKVFFTVTVIFYSEIWIYHHSMIHWCCSLIGFSSFFFQNQVNLLFGWSFFSCVRELFPVSWPTLNFVCCLLVFHLPSLSVVRSSFPSLCSLFCCCIFR